MGAEWPRIRVSMPPRQMAEFKECVVADGRSPGEIIRSLVEPWIVGQKTHAAVLRSIAAQPDVHNSGPSKGPSKVPSKGKSASAR